MYNVKLLFLTTLSHYHVLDLFFSWFFIKSPTVNFTNSKENAHMMIINFVIY